MNDLVDTRSVQLNFLVVRVAHLHERVDVVAATLGLEGQFSTGVGEGFDEFSRLFFVALGVIVDLEGSSAMKDQGS